MSRSRDPTPTPSSSPRKGTNPLNVTSTADDDTAAMKRVISALTRTATKDDVGGDFFGPVANASGESDGDGHGRGAGTPAPSMSGASASSSSDDDDGKKGRGKNTAARQEAIMAVVDASRAAMKISGDVYVREVEDRLPRPVRAVVRGTRREAREFADIFFPTVAATAILSVRAVSEGGKIVVRKCGESLSGIGMAVKRIDPSNFSERVKSVRRKTLSAASETVKRIDTSRRLAADNLKQFVDERRDQSKRVEPDAKVVKDKKRGKKNLPAPATKHFPGSRATKDAKVSKGQGTDGAQEIRDIRVIPKFDHTRLRDPLNGLVPAQASQKIKDALRKFEDVGNLPVVESIKPKVKEFVHGFAERQRVVMSNLHAATEGGVETMREARAELVQRARGMKPVVADAFAAGLARMRRPKSKGDDDEKNLPSSSNARESRRPMTTATSTSSSPHASKSATASAAPSREEELLAKPIRWVVQPQDNLFDIASIAGISVMDLARYNNLRPDPHTSFIKLTPGQELYVPSRALLDRLPAVDVDEEPMYELSVKVRPPKSAAHRFINPALHSRNAPAETIAAEVDEKRRAFALTLAGSLALACCAFAVRAVRAAIDAENDDDDGDRTGASPNAP
jgi:hypothetical protein|mmetsp:Transcript_4218/g.15455  ORF Transcript_4218/g.15455 Transcript_4218/m.15455 type:complete len:625 (-) Transcript_4218:62-1936(-)